MLVRNVFLLLSLFGAFAGSAAEAHDVGGMLVEISVKASIQATTQVSLEASTAQTSCDGGIRHCRPCPWDACWGTRLPVDVASDLQREAYAFNGPTLRDIASRLGIAESDLALAIIQRVPAAPSQGELERILVLAAPT